MPKFDSIDEGKIDSSPLVVYHAVLDEYSGMTHWSPGIDFKPRDGKPFDCEGAICDMTAHNHGMSSKFSAKITKLEEGKSIEMELTGALVGNEKWTFDPFDGKTKVQVHLNAETNSLLVSLFSPFVNFEKEHSKMVQNGFKGCNDYLCHK
jgi:ribosome-associated toxin RatA of RatAB toxin-antitoxin module